VTPGQEIRLSYQLEARELTVRTSYLDPDVASLCLSAVAMLVDDERWSTHTLALTVPEDWRARVPLPQHEGRYQAEHFDALIDSPVHAGPLVSETFVVNGCSHELVLIGSPPQGWPETLLSDIQEVCKACCRLMAEPPPSGDRYQLVILMLDQGYGGLEHDNSAVLHFSWPGLAETNGYAKLLQLVGHEYLHQWNVRRLRPRDYVPYDHGAAVISDCLWFAEGVTSYYDLALPMLAGCTSREQLVDDLGRDLSLVLLSPGVQVQSLADSSREAWIRLYKRKPAGADTQISYYLLGAALSFCLDVRLRQSGASLAQVLRALWCRFGRTERGYCRSDLQHHLGCVDPGLAEALPEWLERRDALPIRSCVASLGLQLKSIQSDQSDTGLTLRQERDSLLIERVRKGGPGYDAGLVAGDELVAVRARRVRSQENWQILLKGEDVVPIVYARRGVLGTTMLTKQQPGLDRWQLSCDPEASPTAVALREAWFQIL